MSKFFSFFQKYGQFILIVGLIVAIVVLSDRITTLKLKNNDYKARMESAEAELEQLKGWEEKIRKDLKEISETQQILIDIYNGIPKDSDIKDDSNYLNPNSSWNSILRPIRAEIDSTRKR